MKTRMKIRMKTRRLVSIFVLAAFISVFFTTAAWALEQPTSSAQVELNSQAIDFVQLDVRKLEATLTNINTKLDNFSNRPSWMTAVVITFLSSTTVALLVISVKRT